MSLEIGGISLLIEEKKTTFINSLKKEYETFLVDGFLKDKVKVFISHSKLKVSEDIFIKKARGNVFSLGGEGFRGFFNRGKNSAYVNIDYREGVFDTFLRVLYSLLLVLNRGVLLHSLGLAKDNQGYIFIGPSSSGKTTLAKKIKGFSVLSDELVIVRRLKERFYIFSTPFGGEYRAKVKNLSVPLKKVFFLKRQRDSNYKRERPCKAFIGILENTFFFLKDKVYIEKIIDIAKGLVESFPIGKVDISANFEDVKIFGN